MPVTTTELARWLAIRAQQEAQDRFTWANSLSSFRHFLWDVINDQQYVSRGYEQAREAMDYYERLQQIN